MLSASVRSVLALLGAIAFAGGLLAIVGGAVLPGTWALLVGGTLIVGSIFERRRYRSDEAELGAEATGPGGGEPLGDRVDPRFRTTEEVFVDPTTGHKMRVLVDPRTGERRYRAEA